MTSREIARQEGVPYGKVYKAVKGLGIEVNTKPGSKGYNFTSRQVDKIVNFLNGKSRSVKKKAVDEESKQVEEVEIV